MGEIQHQTDEEPAASESYDGQEFLELAMGIGAQAIRDLFLPPRIAEQESIVVPPVQAQIKVAGA